MKLSRSEEKEFKEFKGLFCDEAENEYASNHREFEDDMIIETLEDGTEFFYMPPTRS